MRLLQSLLIFVFPTILLIGKVHAQHNWDSAKWDKKSLGFACSIGGTATKPVHEIGHYLREKEYRKIRKALTSNDGATQFVTVVVLEWLEANSHITLIQEELSRMHQIRESCVPVPVCAGYTYMEEVPLKTLLDKNTQHLISQTGTKPDEFMRKSSLC